VYVPGEKIIFIGDADCGDYNNLNGQYDKLKLKSYIKFIQELNFYKYVVGHDKPQSKETAIRYLYEQLYK